MEGDSNAPAPEAAAESTVKKAGSSLMKWVKWGVIGLVGFVVLLFLLAFVFTRGVADAAGTFIDDLQAGNCAAIYEETSEGFQANTSAEDWDAVCNQVSPILQGDANQTSVEVQKSSDEISVGTAVYEILGTDDITYEVTLILVDEDGWKLEGLNSAAVNAEVPEDTTAEEDAADTTTEEEN